MKQKENKNQELEWRLDDLWIQEWRTNIKNKWVPKVIEKCNPKRPVKFLNREFLQWKENVPILTDRAHQLLFPPPAAGFKTKRLKSAYTLDDKEQNLRKIQDILTQFYHAVQEQSLATVIIPTKWGCSVLWYIKPPVIFSSVLSIPWFRGKHFKHLSQYALLTLAPGKSQ